MSKSKGNAIYADELVNYFGVDAVRYFCLHEMPFAQDGTITWELIIERINSDLANILGNLVSRTLSMQNKYFGGVIQNPKVYEAIDQELIDQAKATVVNVEAKMAELRVGDAIDEIFALLRRSNKYIDETTPWTLGKDETKQERLATVLYNLLESIRIAAVLLKSYLPESAEKILDELNTKQRDHNSLREFGALECGIMVTEKPEILFARIDAPEMLDRIEKEHAEAARIQAEKEVAAKAKEPVQEEDDMAKELIKIDDFDKIELKIGKILKCEKHPNADRLLVFQIDLGEEQRQIVSSIAEFFTCEELVGKNVVVVTNLKPAKFRGLESNGMLLCASMPNDEQLDLLTINRDLPAGTTVD